ncbi:MAG TPA: hypothetical protein VG520_02820 [Candidatus Dormibacteraeota bacterium]|jgi:hypothetical protein|nr:hypothetical protein [Candidatus Dormibacteraeota bacterium]
MATSRPRDRRRSGADDDVFLALHHQSGVIAHLWTNGVAVNDEPLIAARA